MRCSTAVSSQDILKDHKESCIKLQPTKLRFSDNPNRMFEDYHRKVDVPIKINDDLESNNQHQFVPMCFKEFQSAVGY